MSNVLLSNTSGQIDFTLRESYARLICSFVGPSGNGGCGFTIQDGAKNTGIFISNSCIDLCKNILNFKQNSNVNLIIPSSTCFSVSGNGSNFLFNQEGTVAFGSGIDSAYKGLQVYSTNPTLVLRDTNASCNQSIVFLDSGANVNFYVCQNSSDGVCLSGTKLKFTTSGKEDSLIISGYNFGFNTSPVPAFNFLFNGDEYISGSLNVLANVTGSALCINNTNAVETGLDVRNRSIFRDDVVFSGNSFFTGSCLLSSNGRIQSPTGCFNFATGNNLNYLTGRFNCLAVNNFICVSGGGLFTGAPGFNTYNFTCICSSGTCFQNLNVNSFQLSGSSYLTGSIYCSNYNSYNLLNNTYSLSATGNLNPYSISFSGNTSITGSLNVFGTGTFSNLNSTGFLNSTGDICGAGFIFNRSGICSQNAISGCCVFSTFGISGCGGTFQNLCQIEGSTISCFCSSGLNVGLNQTGYIDAVNTSKAWAVFRLVDGAPFMGCGYNFCCITTYAQGTAAGSLVYAYGICFCKPIKYPFIINFDIYGSGNALITGHSSNLGLGFSGAAGASLLVAGATACSPFGIQFYALSGKCSNPVGLGPFTVGSTYSEIYFNTQNSKGPTTPYSELCRAHADGIVHFNIFGY